MVEFIFLCAWAFENNSFMFSYATTTSTNIAEMYHTSVLLCFTRHNFKVEVSLQNNTIKIGTLHN